MGLADRLNSYKPPDSGCRTCRFYKNLKDGDRESFDAWVSSQGPLTVLRAECGRDGLQVSDRAFRDHITNHHKTGKVKEQ